MDGVTAVCAVSLYGGCGLRLWYGRGDLQGGHRGRWPAWFLGRLTSFIGRAGPVREVAGMLGEHRLVTVTGSGLVGKTRLAGQVARGVAGRFADGVWLAELAPVHDGGRGRITPFRRRSQLGSTTHA